MRYLLFSVLAVLAIGLFAVPQAFANHGNGEIIYAYVEKGEFAGYVPGETVQLFGLVQQDDSGITDDVFIKVTARPSGNIVTVVQTSVDASGYFSTSIETSSLDYGVYLIDVSYGSGYDLGTGFTVVVAPNTVFNASGSSTPGCEPASCFIPFTLSVNVGETVTWSNTDTAAHTATGGCTTNMYLACDSDGPSGTFDTGLIMTGGSKSITFDEVGWFDYYCMVHPWMFATVLVEDFGESTPADTVPPTVLVPDDITLQTEDQNGASATFNPQAIDNIDELITPTCSPASGSVFAEAPF